MSLQKKAMWSCNNMHSPLLANVVRLIHVTIVVFIMVVPFLKTRNWMLFILHGGAVITLMAHWYMNEDTCFLTFLESALRGIPLQESFMYSIVSPIYKISDEQLRDIVMMVTPMLGMISFGRILSDWDQIERDIRILMRKNLVDADI